MQSALIDSVLRLPRQLGPAMRPKGDRRPAVDGRSWWVWALAGSLFFVYAALSVRIHERMLSHSYDLGIFEQAVRSYADGHLPVSELKAPGFPVLGDHFSPILVLVAPFYMLWRSAATLLVVQAALIAVSVLPLTFWARRMLGSRPAAVIGICYGLSWGIASAVGFDFHEVAFAVPLLALSLTALGTGRPRAAMWWALPMVFVKEDLGLTVAAIGLLIAWRGNRRLGLVTAAAGVTGTLLADLVILPAFNPSGSYGYASFLGGSSGGAGADAGSGGSGGGGLTGLLYKVTIGLITPEPKATTVVLLLAITLFLALRSSLLWVALPTMAWRLVSTYEPHWGTAYHYSLVLMPIVFAAFIEALIARRALSGSVRRHVGGAAAICLLLLPQFPFWQLVQSATWRTDPRLAVARQLMARIPNGATVQASTLLVPQLTNRTTVGLFGWEPSRPDPQWILVDTWTPSSERWPLSAEIERNRLNWFRDHDYVDVDDQAGYVLLARTDHPAPPSLDGIHTVSVGGLALDDFEGSATPGNQLVAAGPHNRGDQRWTFTRQGDGSYLLVNMASGLCVDVSHAATAAGAQVIQWTCTGGVNQRWYVRPSRAGGDYTITSANSGLLLTTASKPGAPLVTQETDTNSPQQHWKLG